MAAERAAQITTVPPSVTNIDSKLTRKGLAHLATSPRTMTPTHKLAETAVGVREAAKCIGRALVKLEAPQTVMIVAKAFDPKIIKFTRQLACHLIDTPRTSCNLQGLTVYIDSKFRTHTAFNYEKLVSTHPHYVEKLMFWDSELCATHAEHIDFVITLGGDGTVIYTSWLFQHAQVPPVVSFDLGSLGFLTNFNIADIRKILQRVIGCRGEGVRINMRMRLSCTVWTHDYKSRKDRTTGSSLHLNHKTTFSEDDSKRKSIDGIKFGLLGDSFHMPSSIPMPPRVGDEDRHPGDIGNLLDEISSQLDAHADPDLDEESSAKPKRTTSLQFLADTKSTGDRGHKPVPVETFQILNDLVVDRGPSAYMSQLELFVDDKHLTTVQADGLVLSTPTGSTAYSLSAGGSLVHPEVPSVLVTPICPHTLSFRPMLLPDTTEIRIQVPADSRNSAWCSFDGRHRIELKKGDFVTVNMSRWPMPTICDADQGVDWFESLKRCLHWNERTRQIAFGSATAADKKLERVGRALDKQRVLEKKEIEGVNHTNGVSETIVEDELVVESTEQQTDGLSMKSDSVSHRSSTKERVQRRLSDSGSESGSPFSLLSDECNCKGRIHADHSPVAAGRA
ncbi:ATP-NAD kinase-like domain-containing protein [Fimicolochytrium jonesii]|uniref:ATP-NAD kinase-like domain-containing protein n=1 Tax=Fimicolochytrium jonesii TaxID=1396493 RepID=UPI0022FE9862|nr:ATP-NAD kinase-like domain-containing protein [Fimicolochytrium jonesii]KAI8825003.1 ATP-NAD kinase-like domain-containing protein [Fimicolochytrium jonesii]